MAAGETGGTRAPRALTALTACAVLATLGTTALRAGGLASEAEPLVSWIAAALVGARVITTAALAARGRVPWTRLPFAVVVGAETCAWLLRVGDARWGRAAVAALEVAALVYAVIAVRGGAVGRQGAPLEERLEEALVRVLPPAIARFVAVECTILRAALGPKAAAAEPAGRSFGYTAEGTLGLLVLAYPILLVGDEMVLQAVLPARWLAVRVAVAALSVYGWVWLIGVHRTMRQRPHVVGAEVVRLHRGVLGSAEIARVDIVTARPLAIEERPRGARLDVPGVGRVELRLRRPAAWRGLFGTGGAEDRVVVSAEDPGGLCAAVMGTSDAGLVSGGELG